MDAELQEKIRNACGEDMEPLLEAVIARYGQLYPDWDVSVITLEKEKDRNAQIDGVIRMLEKMKDRK